MPNLLCTKCKLEKDSEKDFTKGKYWCKKCCSDYAKEWSKTHKRKDTGRCKQSYHSDSKYFIHGVKSRAKRKGIPFDPDLSDVIVPSICPILGIPLVASTTGVATDNSPSLDKIIPSLGYIKGNRWVISNKANMMKSNATYEELVLIGKWAQSQLDKKE